MSIFSDIAGIFGAKADTHAAKNAITNYTTAGKQAIDQYNAANDVTVQRTTPFYEAGKWALQGASNMLQPGYQYSPSDPSYAWRLGQGLDAVQSSAAANGLLHSGGTLKALNNYAQNAASQQYQQDFNNRNTLAQYGLSANSLLANSEMAKANGVRNALFPMVEGVAAADQQKASGLGGQYGSFGSLGSDVASLFLGAPGGGSGAGMGSFGPSTAYNFTGMGF